MTRSARRLVASVAVGGCAVGLWCAQLRIGRPARPDPAEAVAWLGARPVGAVFAAGAWIGLGLAAYLLVALLAGAVSVVARCRRPRLARVLAAVAGPALRLGAVPLLGPTFATADAPVPAEVPVTTDELPQPGTAVLTPLDPTPAPGPPVTALPPARGPDPTTPVPTVPPPSSGTWTIAPGEHLWAVASATVAGHRPGAGDAEVLAYLRALVAANEHVLVVPGEPDLVFPGQVFALPDPGLALGGARAS